jgi:transcriptional regulator with XRE-family HTH domain
MTTTAAPPRPSAIVGANIRALLSQRGWPQARLAAEIGVSTVTITSYVNCKRCPNVDRLGDIAAGLGVPIERLLHVPQCLACADVPEPDRICAQCGKVGPGTPAVMVQAIGPERDSP